VKFRSAKLVENWQRQWSVSRMRVPVTLNFLW
jgi:hypothetical protein